MDRNPAGTRIIGRFAPSPTGDLHFGSLVAAVASCFQARSRGGGWLVRMEDIDPPREIPGSADRILEDLGRFGLRHDGQVLYQSTRTHAYIDARDRLLAEGKAFWCGCSRADLPRSGIYPGTCRDGLPPGKEPRAVRLRVDDTAVGFTDLIQGPIRESLSETCGDFVIWRADDLPAYQLAVVVDDAYQAVSEVVRGADLLDSTCRQIHLQQSLALPTPVYAHHPVAVDAKGRKLSKRLGSDPLATRKPAVALAVALGFLGQPCPAGLGLQDLLHWALDNWRLDRVPRRAQSGLPLLP
ncbi:MAG: tRNA glutamyl-Q(34) synthetase GluQRS [Lysobacterales bacterium]